MPFTIYMPGEGEDPTIDFDRDRLIELIRKEITPIVYRAMNQRKLPPLRKSTIERKTREGFAKPSQPLFATGALEQSVEIKRTNEGLEIYANWYVFFQTAEVYKKYAQIMLLDQAVDRAIKRFLDTA